MASTSSSATTTTTTTTSTAVSEASLPAVVAAPTASPSSASSSLSSSSESPSSAPVSSLDAALAYVVVHYPTLVADAAARRRFEFQERLRCAESKNFAADPERGARGWIALDSIRAAFADPAAVAALDDPKYVEAVHAKLAQIDADGGEAKQRNVRRTVRDIWMFPTVGFPEWKKLGAVVAAAAATAPDRKAKDDASSALPQTETRIETKTDRPAAETKAKDTDPDVETAAAAAATVRTVVEIANGILRSGAVRAVPRLSAGQLSLALTGYRSQLWAQCRERDIDLGRLVPGLARPLVENRDAEHVTLVNSADLAARLADADPNGLEKLEALLAKWAAAPLPLTVTGLMHTISLDWARFGVCLVTGVALAACPELRTFMAEFDALFVGAGHPPVRLPAPHVTVAVDAR